MHEEPDPRPSQSILLDLWARMAVVEAQNSEILRSQGEAAASRKAIHDQLDELKLVAAAVKRLEPVVVQLEALRQQAIGFSFLGKLFWAIAGALATGIGMWISNHK